MCVAAPGRLVLVGKVMQTMVYANEVKMGDLGTRENCGIRSGTNAEEERAERYA
jgi:hypothetical protein